MLWMGKSVVERALLVYLIHFTFKALCPEYHHG